MKGYYLFLWDIDGTLVDVFPGHMKAYETGCALLNSEARLIHGKNRGGTAYGAIYDMLRQVGVADEMIQQNETKIMTKIEETIENYLSDPKHLNIMPGVEKTLKMLDADRCVHTVYSGSTPDLADIILKFHGLRHNFKLCSFAKSREDTRLDLVKRLILYANETFGKPKGMFIFEDSQNGIMVGNQLGAKTIGVATGGHTVDELLEFGADYAFKDLADTNSVIGAIFP
jgi:phosphoglycolate phosphatase